MYYPELRELVSVLQIWRIDNNALKPGFLQVNFASKPDNATANDNDINISTGDLC